jgi:hypothetical protein
MSRIFMFAGALALFAGGCATSADTEQRAEAHDQRARTAAAYENYDQAAAEKRKADYLHEKAAQERVNETTGAGVVPEAPPPTPPAPVPAPPPPPLP